MKQSVYVTLMHVMFYLYCNIDNIAIDLTIFANVKDNLSNLHKDIFFKNAPGKLPRLLKKLF